MCTPFTDKNFLNQIWTQKAEKIEGYHIHIYHDDAMSQFVADGIREQIKTLFPEHLEADYNIARVGPHLAHNIQIDIKKEGFAEILQWLQMNNDGLSILVHPETGDDIKDHLQHSIWVNKELGYNMDFFEKLGFKPKETDFRLPTPKFK